MREFGLEMIYSQGTSNVREDGLVFQKNLLFGSDVIAMVVDATSEPYSPNHPQKLVEGQTSGAWLARFIEAKIHDYALFHHQSSSRKKVLGVNQAIGRTIIPNAQRNPAACLALLRIRDEEIEICQIGDCYVVWLMKNGEGGITCNQTQEHDGFLKQTIEDIMARIGKEKGIDLQSATERQLEAIRAEMWDEFYPILVKARRDNANNPDSPAGYGVLNGDPRLEAMLNCFSLPTNETKNLLLLTDGIIPGVLLENLPPEKLAQGLLSLFNEGGLAKILLAARNFEKNNAGKSHISKAEATGIGLRFD